MKTFLSCFTAPFHRRFWNVFGLTLSLLGLVSVTLVTVFVMLSKGTSNAALLIALIVSCIALTLFLGGYLIRSVRHVCLRGTADELVAGDSVLPELWSGNGLKKLCSVTLYLTGFILANLLLLTIAFVGVGFAMASFGYATGVNDPVVVGFITVISILLIWFLVNGVVANYYFVLTLRCWESWHLVRNIKVAFKHFTIVAVICAGYVLAQFIPVSSVTTFVLTYLPIDDVIIRLGVTGIVMSLIISYVSVVGMAVLGRLYYYLRLRQERAALTSITMIAPDNATVAAVTQAPAALSVEPVVAPTLIVKKAPAKKVVAKKAPMKKAAAKTAVKPAAKKAPVKKAPAKKTAVKSPAKKTAAKKK